MATQPKKKKRHILDLTKTMKNQVNMWFHRKENRLANSSRKVNITKPTEAKWGEYFFQKKKNNPQNKQTQNGYRRREEFRDPTLNEGFPEAPEREGKRSRDPWSTGEADRRRDEKAIDEIALFLLFSFLSVARDPNLPADDGETEGIKERGWRRLKTLPLALSAGSSGPFYSPPNATPTTLARHPPFESYRILIWLEAWTTGSANKE